MKTTPKCTAVALIFLILLQTTAGFAAQPDVSPDALLPYTTETSAMPMPDAAIVALGEATHGNSEFTLLKLDVFQLLVEQKGHRAFALEGDFGGCQKVNAYIHGGDGTAEQAASEIGFAIYRTKEMAELIEWMREFNTDRDPADRIRFYGYDMQRYDNSKEDLFSLLGKADPELCAAYERAMNELTNESMYDLDGATIDVALSVLEELGAQLNTRKESIISATSESEFEMMEQYALCLVQNTILRTAGDQYGTLRDGFMAEKASWILDYESKHFDMPRLFIAGHNSHIGKTTATYGMEKSMGELLAARYGGQYYTIGTEFYKSTFLAPDTETGERQTFTILNSGDHRLAVILSQTNMPDLFLDIDAASENPALAEYLNQVQAMSAVGEVFSDSFVDVEMMYTQSISPAQTYDGLIFVAVATPTTMN